MIQISNCMGLLFKALFKTVEQEVRRAENWGGGVKN
jgi:hypothetical protein